MALVASTTSEVFVPGTSSSAYILYETGKGKKYEYHFTGVTAIEHSLTMNIGLDSSQGGNIVNGAKNLPDRVSLSVVETDSMHQSGWSAKMLECLWTIKRNRYIVSVYTNLGTYTDMLLTEIIAREDDENQFGWSGTLVFTEYLAAEELFTGKANDNSSTRTNTGTSFPARTISYYELRQIMTRAGVG